MTTAACTNTAPPKQAASAAGRSRKFASAPVSLSMRSPTHSGWNTVSGCSRRPKPSGRSGADGGHQDQRHHAEAAVDENHRRGERLRAGGPRRVADADDVAADVARQEVIEEVGDEVRAEQRAPAHVDVLR